MAFLYMVQWIIHILPIADIWIIMGLFVEGLDVSFFTIQTVKLIVFFCNYLIDYRCDLQTKIMLAQTNSVSALTFCSVSACMVAWL